jgi:hypothetical protein
MGYSLLNKAKPNTVSPAPMKTLILATACFMPMLLMAQNPVPRQPRPRADALSQQSGEAEGLRENITIRLQGTTTTGADIDLSLTGIGPRFTADQVINDDTVLTCQYVVSETEEGYRVSYSVSARIRVATQTNQTTTNFEFRDVSISGTVLCVADRPMVLVRNGSKPLQLTIMKEAEAGGGRPATRPESK